MSRLVVTNIGYLATPEGFGPRAGEEQGKIRVTENAYLVCEDGKITAVGNGEVPADMLSGAEVVDAGGKLVTPGLVDAHTHLVFGGWREHELAMKRRGVPYLEILAQGGGISEASGLVAQHNIVAMGDAHEVIAAGQGQKRSQVFDIVLIGLPMVGVAAVAAHADPRELAHEVVLETRTGHLPGIVEILRADEANHGVHKEGAKVLGKAVASGFHGHLVGIKMGIGTQL